MPVTFPPDPEFDGWLGWSATFAQLAAFLMTPCRQSPASASRRPNQLLCLARLLDLLPANGK